MNEFVIVGGSVIGKDHRLVGKNNQDAYGWINKEQLSIALVCDGCGSENYSEVGAKIGVALFLQCFRRKLHSSLFTQQLGYDHPFWEEVLTEALQKIQTLALDLSENLIEAISKFFLFTVVGAIITPVWTYLFSIGDGLLGLNGKLEVIPALAENKPLYLGYRLLSQKQVGISLDQIHFLVHKIIATKEVDSLLIATDGARDLIDSEKKMLPGKQEIVGPLSQFWEDESYFQNQDKLRRTLFLINREVVRKSREELERFPGLLPDDTTLIVIRRKPEKMEDR